MFTYLEKLLFGKSEECSFNTSSTSHIFILPGMLAPINVMFPLVRYLRKHQEKYSVTAIPLGLSASKFEKLVCLAKENIKRNLLSKIQIKEIIIFGHSHGGRVACRLFEELARMSPQTTFSVITAGTPVVEKPKKLSLHRKFIYSLFSSAFRQWPQVNQPIMGNKSINQYIGYYSEDDKVVGSKSAKFGHTGTLVELKKFSHQDFIKPEKMGPILLKI